MATKLGVYNRALWHLGERSLASASEARKPRYLLDEVWDNSLRYCLEQGFWNFAMRRAELSPSLTVTPDFGFAYAFEKPADWIRTAAVSAGPTFDAPLGRYNDEAGHWLADVTPLYVRYVSSHANYGLKLTAWPETFSEYVAAHLALTICDALTQNATKYDELNKLVKRLRIDARSKDAMAEPVGRAPQGSWVRSRGSGFARHDRA